jgi:hypothetical protein
MNADIINQWAITHPRAAEALAKAIQKEPLGGSLIYFPLERSSAPTSSQARSTV